MTDIKDASPDEDWWRLNIAKTFDFRDAFEREKGVRSGEFPPDPHTPHELRWQAEGPVPVLEMDCCRGRV